MSLIEQVQQITEDAQDTTHLLSTGRISYDVARETHRNLAAELAQLAN